MAVIDTITTKEKSIKELLEKLRNTLNAKRLAYNRNTNDWSYLTSLSFTETKLKEVLEYIESGPK